MELYKNLDLINVIQKTVSGIEETDFTRNYVLFATRTLQKHT